MILPYKHFTAKDFEDQTIAIISDIHSNSIALKEAINHLHTQKLAAIFFLGDLFDFGCSPNQVLEQMHTLQKESQLYFIMGNHDYYHIEVYEGREVPEHWPDFLKETFYWNSAEINLNLKKEFPWLAAITIDNILFSHSNPYPFGNWEYMTSDEEHARASKYMFRHGYQMGCFGHTHHPEITIVDKVSGPIPLKVDTHDTFDMDSLLPIPETNESIILNPGSIGLPRGRMYVNKQDSDVMFLRFSKNKLHVRLENIDYSIKDHLEIIQKSSLSASSKEHIAKLYNVTYE